MPPLPAQCEVCGHVFNSQISLYNITLIGAAFATQCPKCGSRATNFEGTFFFSDTDIFIEKASDEVRQKIEALRKSLRIARETGDVAAALAPLQTASPQIAQLATTASSNGGIAALIAFLAYLLATTLSNTNIEFNLNQGIDQAHVYITGSEPYPNLGKTSEKQETTSNHKPEARDEVSGKTKSRQQKRAEERQSRKNLPKPNR